MTEPDFARFLSVFGENNGKRTALFQCTFNPEATAVAIQDVFHDRQTQPSSARLARLPDVHAIEPLGQTRQVFAFDPDTLIAHGDCNRRRFLGRHGRDRERLYLYSVAAV